MKSQLGLTGTNFGRYRVDELIGAGGMAAVYKGFDTRLERTVAVKVLPQMTQTDEYIARFEREAKAMARLVHPHIVAIHDFGSQDGNLFLVMDYLPGGTLENRLKGLPVPCPEAMRFLLPVVQALGYAHAQGVVHRDVKPANILMDADKRPVLTDFGIAKIVQGDTTKPVTRTGVGLGTPDYMAPEQGLGREVDGRADIYSLGVIFYEMLTGQKPFAQGHGMQVMMMHIMEPFPSPSACVGDLPQQVEAVLLKMVEKEAARRYQNMGELADALQGLLSLSAAAVVPEPLGEPRACPACGQTVRPADRFCPACGRKLEEITHEKPRPAEQEKLASVLPPEPEQAAPAVPVSTPQAEWYLQVSIGTQPGRKFPLQDQMIAGRSQSNPIWVNNNNASRRHAQIEASGDGFAIKDLGSTNGTWVNGERISGRVRLRENDTVIIGDTEFVVRRG